FPRQCLVAFVEEGAPGVEAALPLEVEPPARVEREPVASRTNQLGCLTLPGLVDDLDQWHHSAGEFRHRLRALVEDPREPPPADGMKAATLANPEAPESRVQSLLPACVLGLAVPPLRPSL